jgi:uncharacterized protein YegL
MSNTDTKYYDNFAGLVENSVNVKLVPLYNGLPNINVEYELPVLCQIMTGQKNKTQRKPLNIAVVLDRSGSMRGDKLERCKKAILTMVDNLIDDDLFSFIVYDDRVQTVFENCRKSDISRDLIAGVTVQGTTNISGGLEAGVNSLKKSESPNTSVVFLFSDGNANAGNTNLDEVREMCATHFRESGIHFTSYGIGSDFNEKWLKGISSSGHGSYFYIDMKNEDEELTTALLRRGFIEFSRTIAKNVSIRFTPVNSTLTSVKGSNDLFRMITPVTVSKLSERDLVQFMVTVKPNRLPITNMSKTTSEYDVVDAPHNLLDVTVEYQTNSGEDCVVLASCELATTSEIGYNTDTQIYQTIITCGELELQANEYLQLRNLEKARETEKTVITKYEEVLEYDRFGLIGKLLEKARETLHVMKTEKNIERVTKVQGYNAKYSMAQYEEEKYEEEEESAGGAGGLFDDDDDDW